ncbi:MAG: hypothetical protein KF696_11765 [Planctomycetes bacterium]|nr:hypothetical protein [Planctomycetota bacterium]MCW8136965.1 hypothetical protein [Planctomycetota bacterium]
MSAELTLLFLEKRVEAARLCASITEPYATGSEPITPQQLADDYEQVCKELDAVYDELKKLNDSLMKDKTLEAGDIRHIRGRVATAVGEVARAAQDMAAQIRFFEAMNPGDAATTKPALEHFDRIDRGTREFTVPDEPEDGAELAPAEDTGLAKEEDVDPMMM